MIYIWYILFETLCMCASVSADLVYQWQWLCFTCVCQPLLQLNLCISHQNNFICIRLVCRVSLDTVWCWIFQGTVVHCDVIFGFCSKRILQPPASQLSVWQRRTILFAQSVHLIGTHHPQITVLLMLLTYSTELVYLCSH